MGFTKGNVRDEYAQVYDRLRKRSQRLAAKYELEYWDYNGNGTGVFDRRQAFYNTMHAADMLHAAYVRGVRDALAAIVELDDKWIEEAQAMNRRAEAEQDAWDAAHAAAWGEG